MWHEVIEMASLTSNTRAGLLVTLLAAAAVSTIACASSPATGNDDKNLVKKESEAPKVPVTPAATPTSPAADAGAPDTSFTLTVAGGVVNVTRGATARIPVLVSRGNGQTGPIMLSASQLPAGLAAPQIILPAGATSGELTLSATTDAAIGPLSVTLRASATGATEQTKLVSVAVVESASSVSYCSQLLDCCSELDNFLEKALCLGDAVGGADGLCKVHLLNYVAKDMCSVALP